VAEVGGRDGQEGAEEVGPADCEVEERGLEGGRDAEAGEDKDG